MHVHFLSLMSFINHMNFMSYSYFQPAFTLENQIITNSKNAEVIWNQFGIDSESFEVLNQLTINPGESNNDQLKICRSNLWSIWNEFRINLRLRNCINHSKKSQVNKRFVIQSTIISKPMCSVSMTTNYQNLTSLSWLSTSISLAVCSKYVSDGLL